MSEHKHEFSILGPHYCRIISPDGRGCTMALRAYVTRLEIMLVAMEKSRDSYYEDTKTLESRLDRALKLLYRPLLGDNWVDKRDALLKECGRKP